MLEGEQFYITAGFRLVIWCV